MIGTPGDLLTDPTRGTLATPTRREVGWLGFIAAVLFAAWAVSEWLGPDPGMRFIAAASVLAAICATVLLTLSALVRRSAGADPPASTLALLLLTYLGGFGPPLTVFGMLVLDRLAAADSFFADKALAATLVAVGGPAVDLLWRFWHMRSLRHRLAAQGEAPGLADKLAHLEHLAFHDGLTGLPNRRHFERALGQALARPALDCAVMLLDLDKFKGINDVHGHAAGDEFLSLVARRLRAAVRTADVAARLGGDEFAILVAGPSANMAAERLAERIVAAMEQPFDLAVGTVRSGASIGIAASAVHGNDPDHLLAIADEAMYSAKTAGGGRFAVGAVRGRAARAHVAATH